MPLELGARHVRVAALHVDLGPVARREHDGAELLGDGDRVPVGEVEPLAQLERRVPVRHADGEQTLRFMRVRSQLEPGTMLA